MVAVLETLPAGGADTSQMVMGPTPGSTLPPFALRGARGGQVSLAELPGPLVLAFLTSQCSPCLAIAERLKSEPGTLSGLDGLVVITDPEGLESLDLGHPIEVIVDDQNQVMAALQIPGTPFVIAVNADGTVAASQFLAAPEQLAELVDSVRLSSVETPGTPDQAPAHSATSSQPHRSST